MFTINKLSVKFGPIDALKEVSVTIPAGRVTVVIGPNAAGKSTFLRCLIGAQPPTEGRVAIDGDNVRVDQMAPRALARRVAYVAQRPMVSAAFTAREVVELGRYALPMDRNAVERAMAEMDVLDLAERVTPTLSAGQQQRVAVARARAQIQSGVRGALIMDEPTTAMDLHHALRCAAMMRALAQQGHAVIVSLHDLLTAATVADDVLLFDDGRLAAHGTKDNVLNADTLSGVFDVGFEEVIRADGTKTLMPLKDYST